MFGFNETWRKKEGDREIREPEAARLWREAVHCKTDTQLQSAVCLIKFMSSARLKYVLCVCVCLFCASLKIGGPRVHFFGAAVCVVFARKYGCRRCMWDLSNLNA